MAECYPLRLLFKQIPKQRLAMFGTLRTSHCKRRAARFGKGHTPHLLGGAIFKTRFSALYSISPY